ncbi:hypothetical protein VM98_35070, partial [Streptomyces rubellomurinus subsp. indigoferus]
PGAGRDDQAVDHGLAVDELGAGRLDVGGVGRVGGAAAAVQQSGRRGDQRSVAALGDGLVGAEEVLGEPLPVRLVAQLLGGAAAGDADGSVLGRFALGDRGVRRPRVAARLGGGVLAVA